MEQRRGEWSAVGEHWSYEPVAGLGPAPDHRAGGTPTRLVVVVVVYESEAFIARLLDRIPSLVGGVVPTVLVADDASTDATVERARAWAAERASFPVIVLRRPHNLGYGGNQKASFHWALDEGFDILVLLHGDEQYPPERMDDLVLALETTDGFAAFGTRMAERGAARRGGMPRDRYLGNRVLSALLNWLTGGSLSEWFNGFRAYRAASLRELELSTLPDGFDFDTAITARALDRGLRIVEVPMPTRYADEISRVPLLRTGLAGVAHGLRRGRARSSDRSTGASSRSTGDPR